MVENDNIVIVEEADLKDYWQVIIRRKWVIIVSLVTLVIIGAMRTYNITPVYKATVQVVIDRENPNVVSIDEVVRMDREELPWNQTELRILSSRSLAHRVVRALNLKDSPEFKTNGKKRNFSIRGSLSSLARKVVKTLDLVVVKALNLKDSLGFRSDEKGGKSFNVRGPLSSLVEKLYSKKEYKKSDKYNEDSRLVNSYLSRLKVESVKRSRLVNISFEGFHPDIITSMANRHAHEYIEKNLEMRFATSQDAVKWLQSQLIENEKRVEEAENALQLYKEKEKIVSLEDSQNIIVQKLEDLNEVLTDARTERIGLETLNNQAKELSGRPDMIESIPYVIENSLIQALKKDYINTKAEIVKLSDKYGEKFPAMIKLVSQAKEQKNRINLEINRLIKSLETKYKAALSKEESLSNALEEQKGVALDLNRKAIAYSTLTREAESEKAMYDILLKRMKETGITGELKTSNIRIIDAAEIPISPIKPRKRFNILCAAVIGLLLGLGLAFFCEYVDNTVKSPEDIEHYLGLPLLGALEKVKAPKDNKLLSFDMITHKRPKSNIAEIFRNIRTKVISPSVGNSRKLILVTSTAPEEGKTFVVSNLAIAIAQTGKKTLVVDTDFRNPRLNKVFNVKRKPGLSDHLMGKNEIELIIKPTKVSNLSIVTCGRIPPNPSELLGSNSMETFCKAVREKFDIVLFDTPPSLAVTDAVVLSDILDGVIFVIKSSVHERKVVGRAVSQITNKNKKHEVFGVVMNNIEVSRGGYFYHYYSSYYKHGYGEERTSKKNAATI
jgi:capsular exopolysaccharide synthesis family protein